MVHILTLLDAAISTLNELAMIKNVNIILSF